MSEPASLPRDPSTLYTYMVQDHDSLRELCMRLLEAMNANATADTRVLWSEFDHALRGHMDAEERFVLPQFAHAHHAEALSLLREHGELRELLFELGVAVDLHMLRYDRSHDLLSLLVIHATREEKLLYQWIDENLANDAVEAVKRPAAVG